MKTLQQLKNEQMKNPDFAKAYEEIQPEMNVIRAIHAGCWENVAWERHA